MFIFEQTNAEISLNRNLFQKLLQYKLHHISVMTAAAASKTRPHAIMISHCQGDDIFVTF